MNNKFLYCISHKNDVLSKHLFHFQATSNHNLTVRLFSVPSEMFIELETGFEGQPDIFVLDMETITDDVLQLIDKFRSLCKSAAILVVGDIKNLMKMQEQNQNLHGFYYLPKPFTADELMLAVAASLSGSGSLKKLSESEILDRKIEEKVNDSLQKLIDANMAKDQFLSIISHDLKSPIHTILGITEILMNDWDNLAESDKTDFIADINKTAGETHTLLVNLLEWSKIQKEKLKVTITEVKVKELVDTTLHTSHKHASLKGIEVRNEIGEDVMMLTDKNMIATVFRNLISNAVQYTQPGGNIHISALETNDGCTFCVADNGSGVEKTQILDYFMKGNTKKISGNAHVFKGLGLLICKDFVEKTGGEIWLETKKGEGSKFFFTVPC